MKAKTETNSANIVFFDFGNRERVEAETETELFTARVLLTLIEDLDDLQAATNRIRVQIHAVAKEHGVEHHGN